MRKYKGWQYDANVVVNRSPETELYLSFHRRVPGRDWYDEVRYDTHERKSGRRLRLPHYHVKIRGSYRDRQRAEASLVKIIDDIVPQIIEVAENDKTD